MVAVCGPNNHNTTTTIYYNKYNNYSNYTTTTTITHSLKPTTTAYLFCVVYEESDKQATEKATKVMRSGLSKLTVVKYIAKGGDNGMYPGCVGCWLLSFACSLVGVFWF